jgi:hypothetical protein
VIFPAISVIWAVLVLVVYEIRLPMPSGDAVRAVGAGLAGCWPSIRSGGPVVAIAAGAFSIAVFALIQAACYGAGRTAHRWLGRADGRDALAGIVRLLLGWAVAGLAVFGLALAGIYHPVSFIIMTGAMLTAALPDFKLLRDFRLPAAEGYLGFLVRAVVLATAAGTAVCLMAPQTDIDALIMHLALPDRCLKLHKLVPMPANFLFDLPAQSELLAGWALALGGERAARLWGLAGLGAGAAALYAVLKPVAGTRMASVGAALWFTCPFLFWLAFVGKPDLYTAPFVLAATALILDPRAGRRGKLAAGLLAGAAIDFKLLALGSAAILTAILLFSRNRRRPRAVSGFVLLLAGIAAVAGPWLAKAWLVNGDPVHPFGRSGFGVNPAAVATALDYGRVAAIRGSYDSLPAKLAAPWTVTMTDALSPVWLAFVPFVFMAVRAGGPARIVGIAGALGWVGWLLGPPQARYAVPALAWLLAAGLMGIPVASPGLAGRIFPAVAAACLVLQMVRIGAVAVSTWSPFPALGLMGRHDFLVRGTGTWALVLDDLDKQLPPGARVLFVGERRTYPAPRLLLAASIHEPFPVYPLIRASATSEDLARRIRQLGAGYIVHNHVASLFNRAHQALYPWSARDLSVWSDFWRRYVRLTVLPDRLDVDNGGYYIYRLARGRAAPLPTPTLPGVEGVFATVEGWARAGKLLESAETVQVIEQVMGDFPSVKYFLGGFWYGGDAYKSAGYLADADAGGLRNLLLWDTLAQQNETRWQLEEALVYREKIARFAPGVGAPDHIRVLLRLTAKERKKGNLKLAEKYARRAVEVNVKNAAAWADLAEIQHALGWRVAAESAARTAVRLDPGNPGYRDVLARIMKAK